MSDKIILYYTDNCLDENIMKFCQDTLSIVSGDIPIVCVSKQITNFGNLSVQVDLEERSRRAMFLQMKAGLDAAFREFYPQYVYIAEHDCLYPEGYFDFIPSDPETFYYTKNKYFMDEKEYVDGSIINLSTLICHYRLLLAHVNLRLYRIASMNKKKGGWTNCEPAVSEGDTLGKYEVRKTDKPVIDIRHGNNLSKVYGEKIFPDNLREHGQQTIPYWGDHGTLKDKMKWQKSV